MIETITGNKDFIENLKGKSATFILAMSNTKTANIPGITQAGIPGMLHLTPTLDAEFLCTGEVKSLDNIAETPKGVPTPALITRAVHLLKPFDDIELLDLGLEVTPKVDCNIHSGGIPPSGSIDTGAKIHAQALFNAGLKFGESYQPKSDYIILAESVPSGTTTALATALALDYECEEKFSSSFKDVPNEIKQTVIQKALSLVHKSDSILEKAAKVSDNMLIFNAGFLIGASKASSYPILLAGGTQMAAVLLLINRLTSHFRHDKLALCTTKWILKDTNSNIKALLEMLDFDVHSFASDFDFSLSSHPALKLYDEGEAKEGVGAGAALVYGMLNGLSKEEITRQVEQFLG